jgi:hypothetical protein
MVLDLINGLIWVGAQGLMLFGFLYFAYRFILWLASSVGSGFGVRR